jgi:hypothetical protein
MSAQRLARAYPPAHLVRKAAPSMPHEHARATATAIGAPAAVTAHKLQFRRNSVAAVSSGPVTMTSTPPARPGTAACEKRVSAASPTVLSPRKSEIPSIPTQYRPAVRSNVRLPN